MDKKKEKIDGKELKKSLKVLNDFIEDYFDMQAIDEVDDEKEDK